MPAWYKRHFGLEPYNVIFERFEKDFMQLRAPKDMLLVSTLDPDVTLYMRLPDETTPFNGFEPTTLSDVQSKKLVLLVGHNNQFDDLIAEDQRRRTLP